MDVYDKIKNRHLLEQELGILLDDVETAIDLLEHLLTYDDEHDLNEYMEALIGDTSSVVKHFVKNLFRFTSEQEVVAVAGSVVWDDKTKESSFSKNESTTPKNISNGGVSKQNSLNRMNTKPHPQQTIILSSEVKSGDRNEQKVPTATTESQGSQAGNTTKTNPTVQTASFIPQIKSKSSNKKNLNRIKKKKKKSSIETNITSSNNAAAATVVVATTTIPCRPQKGTPSIFCGCFETVHKALTNCLHCGRISCEKEGFNYCPFCHNLVEEFSTVKQTSGCVLPPSIRYLYIHSLIHYNFFRLVSTENFE